MDQYRIRNGYEESDSGSDRKAILSSEEDRLYYLYGDIITKNCASIAYEITGINITDDKKENKEKDYEREPIRIYINSYGGSVYAMWMLIDVIETSKTPVYTYCNGYCMSAAFQIFLSGHKRYVSKHATLMYHQISCWRYGKYQDLVDDMEHTEHLNDQIETYVTQRTKISADELYQIRQKKKDTYYTAEEAIKYGIADEIIRSEAKKAKNKKGAKA